VNASLQGEIPQARTYHKLHKTDKNNWYGNVWLTSNVPFPSIRKIKNTKDLLNQLGKITLILNNIESNPPTEVGFFIHNLVQHNTIQSNRHLQNLIPVDCPEVQQDMCSLWAGPKNSRQGVGVLKIYAHPNDVTTVAKIFNNTFVNSEHLCFVQQDVF
jgi:hypothetical protein